jgi:exodeoxyribonuclease V beta subunit
MNAHFDITHAPLPNGTLVEASAGTGKTHMVAASIARAIATTEDLRIGEILVTTFTRNAAAELRERIRSRLVVSAQLLRGREPPAGYRGDELDAYLAGMTDTPAMARRLERAVAEFDTAIIGTIHSICSRVLRLAGIEAADTGEEELRDRVLDEVVNDAVAVEAMAGRAWDERRLRALVRCCVGDPFIEAWSDPGEYTAEEAELLGRAPDLVQACAARVRERMRATPSFDDLLVRAWEEVTIAAADPPAVAAKKRDFLATLQGRFKLAIVDEAQDTNRLQWELLHALFPPDGTRPLIAVGDPKQAIYRFRGADVTAYVQHAQDGVPLESGAPPRRTLTVNRRSDGPLLHGLNALMAGAAFGPGIRYVEVEPAPGRETPRVDGLVPVEFLDVGTGSLTAAAARKVHELLTSPAFRPTDAGAARPFKPNEVCVLVKSNRIGAEIAKRLVSLKIPAVTTGTASVMAGQMAADIHSLLAAMERPSDIGRTRRAAATAFFGVPLPDVARLGETEEQRIQGRIAEWHAVLQARGMAALATAIMGDVDVAKRVAAGDGGERRIVDFSHLAELLHDAAGGKGIHARQMLEHVDALTATDEKAELVSRRVESDAAAVRIMTVHAAKGLQFPAVVVVDGWGRKRSASQPAVYYADRGRRLDVGYAVADVGTADASKEAVLAAENDEVRRLIYVAVTRPEHHVSIIRDARWPQSLLPAVMPQAPESAAGIDAAHATWIAVRAIDELPEPRRWQPVPETVEPPPQALAPAPARVAQTYRRTSFSDIASRAGRMTFDAHAPVGSGHDENATQVAAADRAAGDGASSAADTPELGSFTIADLPAGTAFGSAVHEIFEQIEAGPDVEPERRAAVVRAAVAAVGTSHLLQPHQPALAAMITAALETPFGGPDTAVFHSLRFADFGPTDRLAEMNFEMGLALLECDVRARDVGRVLRQFLAPGDRLAEYADTLAGRAFDVPLAGLINGSIDAVLRVPGSAPDRPQLLIADYKTNRLHRRDDPRPLTAYAPVHLDAAMAHHHYPLQALVYGTAVWRMLRWRLGRRHPAGWDPGECIAGIVYGFIRGMQGPTTPAGADGRRYGVFTWQPPAGIWRRLSDLFAGDLTGVRS